MTWWRRWRPPFMLKLLLALVLLGLIGIGAVWWLNVRDEAPLGQADASRTSPELIAQGAYLARAGNCAGCHTVRGGAPYAGGRGMATPFGTVFAPNLTPDPTSGLGQWTSAEFWRAMHNGRSRGGRLLYPVFPYPNYTQITRADSDALWAYLRSLPASTQANRPHALRFPFDQQASLAVWRALYFRPGQRAAEARRSAEWQRGAYLVEGLGHCNACHSSRNALGASTGTLDLGGGLIPVQNWYAPSLTSASEASVADWSAGEIAALLKAGVSSHGGLQAAVQGPMAEVVSNSTQYLSDADLAAMAVFLKTLPQQATPLPPKAATATDAALQRGAQLYGDHCAACHGSQGEGAPGAYPALAGNRAVTLNPPANLVHIVLEGGFAPATAGNPRPYGMPPFGPVLNNDELADLLSFIRSSWGNRAAAVSSFEVNRYREGQ